MNEWWAGLDSFAQFLWAGTLVSTLLFAIQTSLTFFVGADHDTDFGDHGDGSDFDIGHSGDTGDIDVQDGIDYDNLHLAEEHTGDIGHHDGDFSFMHYLTVRNFVAFTLGFFWAGVVSNTAGLPDLISLVGGVAMGLVMVFVVIKMMVGLSKFEADGTLTLKDAIGSFGQVTVSVPAGDSSRYGKVLVTFMDRQREIEAVSSKGTISRGSTIKVVGVRSNMLVVSPK